MLQIGDQFDRYQIQAHLSQGGMSDIYRAYDVVNKREVVLKVPDASMIGDPAQFERFQREKQVMSTLKHPAILQGLDSGVYNRTPYLVTELVEGKPLRQMINESAPLPLERAVELVRKIAEGMAYCHDNGVIHRDLKPENILVTAEGQPVIIDFGLAVTPEQVDGKRGDARTDVYALGTMFFELLSAKLPFTADNPLALMALHLNGTAPRLDKVQPGISPQLAAIVARALARNPEQRYQDMHALIAALDHPETAELAVLDQAAAAPPAPSFWNSQYVRAAAAGVLILVFIAALALVLQAVRH
jgi:serine/threonine-protein kinase